MDELYYVYVYLDPRKRGSFIYGEFSFQYEPFYVGISKNQGRKFDHLKEIKSSKKKRCNKHEIAKIQSIIASGLNPIIDVYSSGLPENKALNLEIKLISTIGKGNSGPLTNVLSGGQVTNGELIKLALTGKVGSRSKIVYQFDLAGNLIKKWQSAKEAQVELNISHVSSRCRGDRPQSGEFIWKYKDLTCNRNGKYNARTTNRVKNRTPVVRTTSDGTILKRYSSIGDAVEDTKIPKSTIQLHMSNGKITNGMMWKKFKTII